MIAHFINNELGTSFVWLDDKTIQPQAGVSFMTERNSENCCVGLIVQVPNDSSASIIHRHVFNCMDVVDESHLQWAFPPFSASNCWHFESGAVTAGGALVFLFSAIPAEQLDAFKNVMIMLVHSALLPTFHGGFVYRRDMASRETQRFIAALEEITSLAPAAEPPVPVASSVERQGNTSIVPGRLALLSVIPGDIRIDRSRQLGQGSFGSVFAATLPTDAFSEADLKKLDFAIQRDGRVACVVKMMKNPKSRHTLAETVAETELRFHHLLCLADVALPVATQRGLGAVCVDVEGSRFACVCMARATMDMLAFVRTGRPAHVLASLGEQLISNVNKMLMSGLLCTDVKPANLLVVSKTMSGEEIPPRLFLTDFGGDFCLPGITVSGANRQLHMSFIIVCVSVMCATVDVKFLVPEALEAVVALNRADIHSILVKGCVRSECRGTSIHILVFYMMNMFRVDMKSPSWRRQHPVSRLNALFVSIMRVLFHLGRQSTWTASQQRAIADFHARARGCPAPPITRPGRINGTTASHAMNAGFEWVSSGGLWFLRPLHTRDRKHLSASRRRVNDQARARAAMPAAPQAAQLKPADLLES